MAARTRAIALRAAVVLGIAAIVVAGGLLAGLRGGGDSSSATPAAPSAVRATLDPVTSLTGDATQVSELQSRLQLHPANARLQGDLGIAYLQRARETNDPSYYTKAQTLLDRSLKRDPAGVDATIGAGSLALSYHDFRKALRLGRTALALSHGFSPPALAMIGDASVELGRYDQGFAAFARLGHLRPGLVAYARLSYARELQGDVPGAIRLMRRAVDAGSGAPENTQWTRVQLAALLLKSGHVDAAAKQYRHALALLPNYARAEAGLGAVAVARGNLAQAERWYDTAASHLPLPDIVASLGDVRAARGDRAGAPEAYTLVGFENALFIRAGGNADLETALFDANHPGMKPRAAVVALARKALAFRPSVYGHDSLAWALYAAGKCRQALPQAMLANRLGTIDPELSWHLGAIAACAGRRDLARTALRKALAHTPRFHPLDAPRAQRLLEALS
jgi:tetratricopeptide (TPR) repeat protein